MALEAARVEFIRKMTPKGLVCGLSIGSTVKKPKEPRVGGKLLGHPNCLPVKDSL